MFLVARVGNSSKAKEFISHLESNGELDQMVFCSMDGLDPSKEVFQRGGHLYSKHVSKHLSSKGKPCEVFVDSVSVIPSYFSSSWPP